MIWKISNVLLSGRRRPINHLICSTLIYSITNYESIAPKTPGNLSFLEGRALVGQVSMTNCVIMCEPDGL